jgi:cell division protein ZipA
MSDLRLVLFIIGALLLIALLVHGVWTVRKNSGQPKHRYYDESADQDKAIPTKAEGFDELGIGEVRVVKQSGLKTSVKAPTDPALRKASSLTSGSNHAEAKLTQTKADAVQPELQTELAFTDSQEPELNFSALADDEPSSVAHDDRASEQEVLVDNDAAPEPSEVLILYVLLPENKEIKGDDLLSALLTLGFKYGDMDIFHRHIDSSGSGKVLFSLANMFNPGTFDLDNMNKLSTRGVSLFMTLPGAGDALQNFNLMHNAAKKLASEFSGQVLDGQRSVLTVQTVRHYVDKIREFQRQKLIHG